MFIKSHILSTDSDMTRTALITGASGLLGRKVLQAYERAGWNAVGTGLSRATPPILKVDLLDQAAVESTLDEVRPQIVVHCAANRFPDRCEAEPETARALNIDVSRKLAHATASRSILLIYISTDYVFSGKPGEAPYDVDALTQPPNLYGQTKLDGEKAVLEETEANRLGIILRVPVLYGTAEEPKESSVNVLMETVWKAQENDANIVVDDWAQRYPTNTEDVGRVCLDLGSKYLAVHEAEPSIGRIFQFSSEDRFTKFEICQLFAEIMGLPLNGVRGQQAAGDDPHASVQRPYDTHLSSQSLKDLGINVQTQSFKAWWRWQVRAVRK